MNRQRGFVLDGWCDAPCRVYSFKTGRLYHATHATIRRLRRMIRSGAYRVTSNATGDTVVHSRDWWYMA